MNENKISIEINRPVSEVFEFTINPKNTPSWIAGIIREEASEFPPKIGTIYKNVDKHEQWTSYKVVKLITNKLFEMEQEDGSYNVRYSYEPISDTKTKLTYYEWVDDEEDLEAPFSIRVLEKLKEVVEK